MDLLLRAYPLYGMRPMEDIDLLIHVEDIPRVKSLLEEKGFKRIPDEGLTYLSPERKLNLDMIWDIWYLQNASALWQRAVDREFEGITIQSLHPEDALFYFVAFVVAHRGVLSSLFAQDLDCFLEREGSQIHWERWIEEVNRLHFRPAFYHGLSYAKERGLQRIPERVLDSLRPVAFHERMLTLFYKMMATEEGRPDISYLHTWFSYPGVRGKMKLLKEKLLPTQLEVTVHYGEKTQSRYALLVMIRPLVLLLKGFILVAKDAFFLLHRLFVPRCKR